MHEGLIILHKSNFPVPAEKKEPRVVMFCNRPAKKLFTNFIGVLCVEKDGKTSKPTDTMTGTVAGVATE